MPKRRLLLSIAVIAVIWCVYGYIHQITNNIAPASNTASIDASNIPVTAKALKSEITITEIHRVSPTRVDIDLKLKGRNGAPLIKWDSVEPMPDSCSSEGTTTSCNSVDNAQSVTVEMKHPKGLRRIDLCCHVYLEPKSKKRMIRFNNVSASSLPITKSYNNTNITLEKAYPGYKKMGDESWNVLAVTSDDMENYRNYFVIQLKGTLPNSPDFNGRVKVTKDEKSAQCLTTSYSDHWFKVVRVSDSTGRTLDIAAERYNPLAGPSDAFFDSADKLTTTEKMVGKVSNKLVSQMITNRALREARAAKHVLRNTYMIQKPNNVSASFNVDVELNLPLDPDEMATVVFNNLPLP